MSFSPSFQYAPTRIIRTCHVSNASLTLELITLDIRINYTIKQCFFISLAQVIDEINHIVSDVHLFETWRQRIETRMSCRKFVNEQGYLYHWKLLWRDVSEDVSSRILTNCLLHSICLDLSKSSLSVALHDTQAP